MLLTLAGMRSASVAGEDRAPTSKQQRSAVLFNLFLDGGEDRQVPVIDEQIVR